MLCDKGSISLAVLCLLTMVIKYLASKRGFLVHKLKGDSPSWWGRQRRVVLWWQKHSVADTCSPLSRSGNIGKTGSEPDNLKACPSYLLLPVRLHHLRVLQSPKTAAAEDHQPPGDNAHWKHNAPQITFLQERNGLGTLSMEEPDELCEIPALSLRDSNRTNLVNCSDLGQQW